MNMHAQSTTIETHYVITAARRRTPAQAAAMRWLVNYLRITGQDVEALAESGTGFQPVSGEAGLTLREIREALCFPQASEDVISRFTKAVRDLREDFEQRIYCPDLADAAPLPNPFRPGSSLHDAYGPIAKTAVSTTIERALNATLKRGAMAEIIGLTRLGKTVPGARWFLRNMDTAIYCICPPAASERDFLLALASACGVAAPDTNMVGANLRARIESAFAQGGYQVLIIDEAHNVWHQAGRRAPVRIEFLRRLHDHLGVGVGLIATPQFTDGLTASFAGHSQWAPGQYDGRVLNYQLPETLSDADLTNVARHHAPDFDAGLLTELVTFAKASQGYCGAMVNAITRAREAFEDRPTADRLKLLTEICKRQQQGRGVEIKAKLAQLAAVTKPLTKIGKAA